MVTFVIIASLQTLEEEKYFISCLLRWGKNHKMFTI